MMNNKRVFTYLLLVNGISLSILLGLSFFKNTKPVPVAPKNVKPQEIVISKLEEFGIRGLKFKVVKDTLTVTVDSIGNDFPVQYLMYEIQKELAGSEFYLTGAESEINYKTTFLISGDGPPVKIRFNFIRSGRENSREIVLFVRNPVGETASFIKNIKSLNFPVTVILTPAEGERVFSKTLTENDLEFGVFITPEIKEELYKISENLPLLRIQQTINRLAIDFEGSNSFIIEGAAAKYRSSVYEKVRRRIIAANKPVFLADTLVNLTAYDEAEITGRMNKLISTIRPGKQEIVLFPYEYLFIVNDLIPTLSKKSIRITSLR